MQRAKRFSVSAAAEKIRKWLNEESDSDCSDIASTSIVPSVVPPGECSHSQHPDNEIGSETEDVVDQSESTQEDTRSDKSELMDVETSADEAAERDCDIHYTGRSGIVWKAAVQASTKTKAANIVRQAAGPNVAIRDNTNAIDIFHMFVTPEILSAVLQFTNAEGVRRSEGKQPPCTDWKLIAMKELQATLGLLYMGGVFRMNKVSARRMWATHLVLNPVFPAVMSGERFAEILCVLRFDDRGTRESRRATDKFAPIRDLWNLFIEQNRKLYTT